MASKKLGLCITFVLVACFGAAVTGFNDESPRYNYDTLPKTSFTCKGKVPGRYYADAELECQAFHVCVKMSARDTQDFKFLCPNGTTFDQEHQVCMDYFQVVCHEGVGTNPLGHIYELMKLSSLGDNKNSGLDTGKLSFVDPDVAEKNTLGDDFQVQEYNNNRLAASQNSFNVHSSKSHHRKKEPSDIFYKHSYAPTKYTTAFTSKPTTSTTTTTTTPRTTTAPLRFRSPISTNAPPSSTEKSEKRKPNLETYESYEIESVHGLTNQNQFNQYANNQPQQNYDYSYEAQDPEPSSSSTTSTTHRPIFHNTFRSPLPLTSTSIPPVQTFQQQASRFNEDFFRKLPSSTEKSVSKAAQFYVNSQTKFRAPEIRQPSTNPFLKSTTEIPFSSQKFDSRYQPYEPLKTNDRSLSSRGSTSSFSSTQKPYVSDFTEKERATFHSQNQVQGEDIIRPRSFSGNTNGNANHVSNSRVSGHRDNFGFSTIPPPTTAEPHSYSISTTTLPPPVTSNNAVTYFQRLTTLKPEKYSIFYNSKSTTYGHKEYPSSNFNKDSSVSTVQYYEPTSTNRPVPSERVIDAGFGQKEGVTVEAQTSTTTPYPVTEPTVQPRSQRRGTRRRISRPRQQQNSKKFDPELKYARRREQIQDKEKVKDEILDAEASVFRGQPTSNLFDEKTKSVSNAPEKAKVSTEGTPKVAENFGKKIRVNSIRRQFASTSQQPEESPSTSAPVQTSTQGQRRLIKRLKVKTTTPADTPTTTGEPSTTTVFTTTTVAESTTPFPTTTLSPYGSTLRPVKRIQVKTKIGTRKQDKLKDSEFRVPPVQTSSVFEKLKKFITSSTTTPEPELVTASDEDILLKKLKKYSTFKVDDFTSTPTTFRPFDYQNSSVVIKVTQKTHKSAFPTPISFKEPILPKHDKIESRVEVKHSISEDSTRSPDYDYAYYNTDDDYVDVHTKLDTRNYGKKPVKKALPSPV